MNYLELKKLFTSYESNNPEKHLTAYITFSSFGPRNQETYSWESRTYVISSDNKAFQPRMGGYSIFGSCLDGSDQHLRLDVYMKEEQGGKDGWAAEDCCIVGYQVPDCDNCGVVQSRLFFFYQEALDHVLRHMAYVLSGGRLAGGKREFGGHLSRFPHRTLPAQEPASMAGRVFPPRGGHNLPMRLPSD